MFARATGYKLEFPAFIEYNENKQIGVVWFDEPSTAWLSKLGDAIQTKQIYNDGQPFLVQMKDLVYNGARGYRSTQYLKVLLDVQAYYNRKSMSNKARDVQQCIDHISTGRESKATKTRAKETKQVRSVRPTQKKRKDQKKRKRSYFDSSDTEADLATKIKQPLPSINIQNASTLGTTLGTVLEILKKTDEEIALPSSSSNNSAISVPTLKAVNQRCEAAIDGVAMQLHSELVNDSNVGGGSSSGSGEGSGRASNSMVIQTFVATYPERFTVM